MLTKPVLESTDIILDIKEQKRCDCALMLDTSLSMTGKKLALLAVAAAVVAYKLPSEDFAIISFESTASTLKKMRARMPIEQVVTKILQVPAVGYTNVEAALEEGLRQLAAGRHKKRVGILLSDGKYTAGGSPLPVASRYRNLHVVLLGDFNTDPAMCSALAVGGHGMLYRAPSFESLPRTLNRLVADLLT
ncbi:MAG: VWA domain-containing protein [Candidatus Abyssobacteria bacterium SURF_17]|uniref:VWA domain-containing protein n=1 Tax=Candidatus Abyssobacteria bacterium SURF_17 TaxID=2093361 RepID=A0A419EZS3_9BACT|nr:MAG: VWA domain-containing protein [Candidatus Abyssubacteria bacterium SURF_17]